MKKMMKAFACGFALVVSLGLGMIAEAGRIPSHMVPLQTYATKKLTCYVSPGGAAKGWIDPGDYVIVNQIRNDGWAYGSYPVKNGRTSRWFRVDDLLNNPSFTTLNRMSPQYKINVYKNYSYNGTIGSVWGNEDIWVVSNLGDVWQIVYKVTGGGYKMGWVPYWDCLEKKSNPTSRPTPNPTPNPIISPVSRAQPAKRSVYVYTDSSLTNYYNNCWLVNGQNYSVIETKNNALKVKFNNQYQGNRETIGWITNEVQRSLEYWWPADKCRKITTIYRYSPYNTKSPNQLHSCKWNDPKSKKPYGIDIGCGDNAPVYATEGGTVLYAGWGYYMQPTPTTLGYIVILDHGQGKQSLYAHLKFKPNLKNGQYVIRGQLIGRSGGTGGGKGDKEGNIKFPEHLHFELNWTNPYELFGCENNSVYQRIPHAATMYHTWPCPPRSK